MFAPLARCAHALHALQDVAGAYAMAGRMKEHETWPRERIVALQQTGLDKLVRHAVSASPFYRQLYRDVDLSRPIELRSLPTVDKALLMQNFDKVVTDRRLTIAELEHNLAELKNRYHLGRYRIQPSTGSSGQKGVWVWDPEERQAGLAGILRRQRMIGEGFGLSKIQLSEISTLSPRPDGHWGLTIGLRPKKTQELDPRAPLPRLVGWLNEFQPNRLFALSSQLALLAAEQLDGRLAIKPQVVTSLMEPATKEIKERVAEAWGVTPFEVYGMSELGGMLAADCVHHQGMHLFEDLAIIEVVDGENRPVPLGQTGSKILLTNLAGRTQPRIRYEIPDMVALSEADCPCERTMRVIRVIEGRSDDGITLPGRDGRPVAIHSLHFRMPIARIEGVKEHQTIFDGDSLRVRVVLRDSASADIVAPAVRTSLLGYLEPHNAVLPQITVEIVDDDRIERDPRHGGKFKLLVDKTRETVDSRV